MSELNPRWLTRAAAEQYRIIQHGAAFSVMFRHQIKRTKPVFSDLPMDTLYETCQLLNQKAAKLNEVI